MSRSERSKSCFLLSADQPTPVEFTETRMAKRLVKLHQYFYMDFVGKGTIKLLEKVAEEEMDDGEGEVVGQNIIGNLRLLPET